VAQSDQNAFAVWITGLPASGKSTVTKVLAQKLRDAGITAAVLESDALRAMFSEQPRYDDRDRDYFYGSLAFIGRVLTGHGVPVIFDATANLRSYRDRARRQIPRFIEVFVDCPLETCIRRDPKGIYKKVRDAQAAHVPGVQTKYEPPETPEVVINGDRDDPEDAAARIIGELRRRHFLL
jgi:adenylylsulfate kinase